MAAVSLLVVVISVYAVQQGRRKGATGAVIEEPVKEPRVEIGPNKFVGYSPTGEVIFQAEMTRGEYDRSSGAARLWGVKCQIMEREQQLIAVEAERLDFFFQEDRAVFEGQVRACSEKEGVEVTCEDLHWDVKAKTLYSDKPAKFRRGATIMEGNRLEADVGLKKVSLYDGAKFSGEFKAGKKR